jgi:regulatory protein
MTNRITGLEFQKRNRHRVNVYLDGRFAFGLAAIVAAKLQVGQTLSEAEITRLRETDDAERAYERALSFLSYRPRSEAEVRRNLRKKGLEANTIDDVVARLMRAGLLDDAEFARYWVENRERFRPRGRVALRQELRGKGVPDPIIADAVAKVDEEAAARQALQAASRRYRRLAPPDYRRRVQAFLARRGFSYAVTKPLIDEMIDDGDVASVFGGLPVDGAVPDGASRGTESEDL